MHIVYIQEFYFIMNNAMNIDAKECVAAAAWENDNNIFVVSVID